MTPVFSHWLIFWSYGWERDTILAVDHHSLEAAAGSLKIKAQFNNEMHLKFRNMLFRQSECQLNVQQNTGDINDDVAHLGLFFYHLKHKKQQNVGVKYLYCPSYQ